MKNKSKILIKILPVFFLLFILIPYSAYALEVNYPSIPTPSGPFDLDQAVDQGTITLGGLIFFVYALSIWVGGIYAFILLVYLGFTYIVAGAAPGARQKAKKWLKNVLWGLLILLFAVTIFDTINENILELENAELFGLEFDTPVYESKSIALEGFDTSYTTPSGDDDGTTIFCYEQCIAEGNTPSECSSLPACPDTACPMDNPHWWTEDWLTCRNKGSQECSTCSGCARDHKGIDIFADVGTKVFAHTSGMLRRVGDGGSSAGWRLYIRGDDGNTYQYLHLDGFAPGIPLSEGDVKEVVAGEHIAYSGCSGGAACSGCQHCGPHLHLEIFAPESVCSTNSCTCYADCFNNRLHPEPRMIQAGCIDTS